jgi:hypothetical protein
VQSALDIHRVPRPVIFGFTVLASLGMAVAAGVNAASYGPATWGPMLLNLAIALFPGVFPLFFLAIAAIYALPRTDRRSVRRRARAG